MGRLEKRTKAKDVVMAHALLFGANQNPVLDSQVVGRVDRDRIFGKRRVAAYIDGGPVVGRERRVLAHLKRAGTFGPMSSSVVIPPELPREGVILSADVKPGNFQPGAPRIVVASFIFDRETTDFDLDWVVTKVYGPGAGPIAFTAAEVKDHPPIEAIRSSGKNRFEITQTTLLVGQKLTSESLAEGLETQRSKDLNAVFPRFKSRTITTFSTI